MILEKLADNYDHWHSLFLVVLNKYNLMDHVLSDISYTDCSTWVTMDYCFITWVYSTISNDL